MTHKTEPAQREALIIPAVLPKSFEEVVHLAHTLKGVASRIQIDVSDGRCGRVCTWPLCQDDAWEALVREEAGLPAWEQLDYEIDLMVGGKTAYALAQSWVRAGAAAIIVHSMCWQGEERSLWHLIEELEAWEVEVGVAVRVGEEVAPLRPLLERASFVQVMGHREIGVQGLNLDLTGACEQQRNVRMYAPVIGIDIGVNEQTLPALAQCGFQRFAVGSAIVQAKDPRVAYKRLVRLAQQLIG